MIRLTVNSFCLGAAIRNEEKNYRQGTLTSSISLCIETSYTYIRSYTTIHYIINVPNEQRVNNTPEFALSDTIAFIMSGFVREVETKSELFKFLVNKNNCFFANKVVFCIYTYIIVVNSGV